MKLITTTDTRQKISTAQSATLTTCIALLIAALYCPATNAKGITIQADVGYMYDDNVTRASDEGSILTDNVFSANISIPATFLIAEHVRLGLSGSLGAEKFAEHDGLSHAGGALRAELQYRGSAEFGTPIYSIFVKTSADTYQSELRSGQQIATGLSMQKRFTSRIQAFSAVTHTERTGENSLFDHTYDAARINIDYDLPGIVTMYLGVDYRDGDLVTTNKITGAYGTGADIRDKAFSSRKSSKYFSYKVNGTTLISTLGFNIGVGQNGSLDFSWRQVDSTASYFVQSLGSNATLSYATNQYSIVYLTRF